MTVPGTREKSVMSISVLLTCRIALMKAEKLKEAVSRPNEYMDDGTGTCTTKILGMASLKPLQPSPHFCSDPLYA